VDTLGTTTGVTYSGAAIRNTGWCRKSPSRDYGHGAKVEEKVGG
jgi:hypothetical protein